jgi:hypothetical protein
MDDYIVVVTDRNDPRFGQIGKLWLWEWYHGVYMVQFLDGRIVDYPDGKEPGDPPSPVTLFRKSEFLEKFDELFE